MHFPPANAKSLKVRKSFQSAVSCFSKLSVISCRCEKLIVKIFPSKVCEELSARKSCPKSKVCQNRKVCLCRIADSSSKTFHTQNFVFLFFTLTHNDRGYGHWRFAGAFAVVERQGECGSKTAGMHVSQPMRIGVC